MTPRQMLWSAVDAALAAEVSGAEILSIVHWHVLACGSPADQAYELSWGERPHGSN